MPAINKNQIITDEALKAPLELATNMDKVAKSILKIVDAGKKSNATIEGAKSVKDLSKSTKDLSDREKELLKVNKQIEVAQSRNNKEYAKKQSELKRVREESKKLVDQEQKLVGTEEKLIAQNKRLRDERRKLNLATKEGLARSKQINTQLDKNTQSLKGLNDSYTKQKMNIGNYESALSSLSPRLSMMIGQIRMATKASLAFIATPIGAVIGVIVAALGTLGSFFANTQRGADKLGQVLSGLKAGFDVIIDRVSSFGEGLLKILSGDFSDGVDQIRNSFKGIGDEMSREIKLASELEARLQDIARRQTAATVEEARIRSQIEKDRLIAEDKLNVSITDRIAALKRAISGEEELATLRMDLIKDELIANIQGGKDAETRLKAEQLINDVIAGRTDLTVENLGISESSLEDLQVANEKIAELIDAQTIQYKRQRSEVAKLLTLQNEYTAGLAKDFKYINKELDELGVKFDDSFKLGEDSSGFNELFDEIIEEGDAAIEKIVSQEQSAADQTYDIWKESYDKRKQAQEELSKKSLDLIASGLDLTAAIGANQIDKIQEDLNSQNKLYDNQLEAAEGNEERQSEILAQKEAREEESRRKIAKIRQRQAIADKALAITQIAINTANSVLAALAPPPLGLGPVAGIPLSIVTGAIGAAQIATVIAQPIPQFAKGTDNSPEGLAIVNEKGSEILESPDGSMRMINSNKPTLTYLEKGTKVHTAEETASMLGSNIINSLAFQNVNERTSNQSIINRLDLLNKTIKGKKETHIKFDRHAVEFWTKKGDIWNKIRNSDYA